MKIALYTAFALLCFAFNSILCRLALRAGEADAAGFTLVRLASGALVLWLLVAATRRRGKKAEPSGGNWASAFFLFLYAVCFSFAYLGLTAATGALVLFGAVQATMIVVSIARGEHPRAAEWLGLLLALAGLVYLVFPGLEAPPAASSLLMAAAGAAWGFYTLRGRASRDPLNETAGNFLRAVPMMTAVAIPFIGQLQLSSRGLILAVLSGAVASGLGYSVWYATLKHHTPTRAAVLQLSVPAIAAAGGIVFLAESMSLRLIVASSLILGGIGLVIWEKNSRFQIPDSKLE